MVGVVLIYDLYREEEKRKVRGQGEGGIIFIVLFLQVVGRGDTFFLVRLGQVLIHLSLKISEIEKINRSNIHTD